jgi:hypothetical protein
VLLLYFSWFASCSSTSACAHIAVRVSVRRSEEGHDRKNKFYSAEGSKALGRVVPKTLFKSKK